MKTSLSPASAVDQLLGRASASRFGDAGPSRVQLDTLLASAVTAADHARLRPWRFVIMQGESRGRLAELLVQQVVADNPEASEAERQSAHQKAFRAPLVIALLCKPRVGHKVPIVEQQSATAAAGAHLMLAANALGFGAAWKTGVAAYHPAVREGFGLDEQDSIIGFFYIGEDASPRSLPRASADDVVEYW